VKREIAQVSKSEGTGPGIQVAGDSLRNCSLKEYPRLGWADAEISWKRMRDKVISLCSIHATSPIRTKERIFSTSKIA